MPTSSIDQVSQAIADLINSSPRSPTKAEIANIIIRASPKPDEALALSAEHMEYRRLVAEISRLEWEGCSEETLDPLTDRAKEFERKTWSTPAKTLADVLLRGEMARHHNSENGTLEGLNDSNGYFDTRSAAQLIKAVIDVRRRGCALASTPRPSRCRRQRGRYLS
jgi:hypothetical protein